MKLIDCKWYWAILDNRGVTVGMHPTLSCAEKHLEILNSK